eukprot:4420081-Pyramimonas_sp.AAC.1
METCGDAVFLNIQNVFARPDLIEEIAFVGLEIGAVSQGVADALAPSDLLERLVRKPFVSVPPGEEFRVLVSQAVGRNENVLNERPQNVVLGALVELACATCLARVDTQGSLMET